MSFQGGGPYNVTERILSSAEILSLDTVPVELLPAKTGVLYMPYYVSFYKAAGTGYTAADMVLENANGIQFVTVPGAGFLDQAVEAVLAQKISGGKVTSLGRNLQLRLTAATATGDQAVRVKLIYIEEYPGMF